MKSYQYTARSEFSGTLDLIRVAYALVEWAVNQGEHRLGVTKIEAAEDVMGCSEIVIHSTLDKPALLAVMRLVMTEEKCPDCHRVYETLNYTAEYDGDVVNVDLL